ncbi:hypothetical protein FOVG_17428 [Fusarium oxysporum f. sp. pisi HDV247]|uniref:Uncharacterized protein n=1 Tax=Fusarium oxysporum f. sp. pisi HDV247 TaxID=1080344 RepID=W9NKI0_FUSOX|nr:hypothetical protein FOVG_17428 [Fusarium oxysporum f. sp. pisi HDV247]
MAAGDQMLWLELDCPRPCRILEGPDMTGVGLHVQKQHVALRGQADGGNKAAAGVMAGWIFPKLRISSLDQGSMRGSISPKSDVTCQRGD